MGCGFVCKGNLIFYFVNKFLYNGFNFGCNMLCIFDKILNIVFIDVWEIRVYLVCDIRWSGIFIEIFVGCMFVCLFVIF